MQKNNSFSKLRSISFTNAKENHQSRPLKEVKHHNDEGIAIDVTRKIKMTLLNQNTL